MYVKKKKLQDIGDFSRHPVRPWTKRFRSGIRVTRDRIFILPADKREFLRTILNCVGHDAEKVREQIRGALPRITDPNRAYPVKMAGR